MGGRLRNLKVVRLLLSPELRALVAIRKVDEAVKFFVVTSLDDYLLNGRPGRPEGTFGQASDYATTLGEGNWDPLC